MSLRARRRRAGAIRCRRARGSRLPGPVARVRSTPTIRSRGLRSGPGARILSGRRSSSSTSTRPSTCSISAPTQIPGGTPSANNQVQGYDCVSTGTQAMPPSWTDNNRSERRLRHRGRVYQTVLPFNSFFDATKLHPDGEIDVSYSDDLGRHWVKGNGGAALEPSNNASAKQLGHVEDKQWVAVNHIPGNRFQDHVYAAWAVFNGNGGGIKVRMAVSRDRGQTFARPSRSRRRPQVGPGPPTSTRRSTRPGTSTSRSSRSRRTGELDDLRRPLDRRRADVRPVRAGRGRGRIPPARPAEHALPRRDHGELRRQPDLSRPPLPDVRGLGRDRRADGRQVHPVHRRRRHTGRRRSSSTTTSTCPARRPTSSSPRLRRGRTAR